MTVRSDENTAGEVARPRRLHRPAPLPHHCNRRPTLAVVVGGEPQHQSGGRPVRSVNPPRARAIIALSNAPTRAALPAHCDGLPLELAST
jgi:hypothetical protein